MRRRVSARCEGEDDDARRRLVGGVWVVSGYYDGARSEMFERLNDAFQSQRPSPPKPGGVPLAELLRALELAHEGALTLAGGERVELESMIRAMIFDRPEEVMGEVIEGDE